MKIGVIVCDPGDRPEFADQYPHLIRYQTVKANVVHIQGHRNDTGSPDLVSRMQEGCNWLADKCDVILVFENDDFYSRRYIDQMAKLFIRAGEPDIFGLSSTYYYHLALRQWIKIEHPGRASLFTTAIKASAVKKIKWPDESVMLDIHLWSTLKGRAVEPATVEAIGIKHGLGRLITHGHDKNFYRYSQHGAKDESCEWLKQKMGDSVDFYIQLSNKLRGEKNGS